MEEIEKYKVKKVPSSCHFLDSVLCKMLGMDINMKTEFKSNHCKGINPLDAMFCKYNLDVFNKLYGNKYQKRMNGNKKNQSKALKKSDTTNKSCVVTKQERIDVLPASGHDICNYLARNSMSTFQIQAIMKLDGRLDFDKLKRAVRLSVDAEPVLGCRFVEDDRQYWKRLENIEEITFCSLEETDNSDEAVMSFLRSPLDMDNDPKVIVKLVRTEEYDILAVKVNHACCDGTGTKAYIQLLSHIYSRIDQCDSTFIPETKIVRSMNQDELIKDLDITNSEIVCNPMLDTQRSRWRFPWMKRGEDSTRFVIRRLPQERLESIYQYGKSKDATVNDLILTAFYRTMFRISKPKYGTPMDISSTVDLRSYLPEDKNQGIRNLSGGIVTRIPRIMNESFEGTLARVVKRTDENTSFTYYQDYFERIFQTNEISEKRSTHIGNICFPGLWNLGYISEDLISFGEKVVTDAYVIPPVIRAPGFLLLASSYNGILTMSIGYNKASISQKDMRDLLNVIDNELMRGCEVK